MADLDFNDTLKGDASTFLCIPSSPVHTSPYLLDLALDRAVHTQQITKSFMIFLKHL